MFRATTPTHTFNLPFSTGEIDKLKITYAQGDKIVLEKDETDCTLSGYDISVTLTQEETLLFNAERVCIQVRVLTTDGTALASNIERRFVEDVLNDEVMS